jgi:hypothetical protein
VTPDEEYRGVFCGMACEGVQGDGVGPEGGLGGEECRGDVVVGGFCVSDGFRVDGCETAFGGGDGDGGMGGEDCVGVCEFGLCVLC